MEDFICKENLSLLWKSQTLTSLHYTEESEDDDKEK